MSLATKQPGGWKASIGGMFSNGLPFTNSPTAGPRIITTEGQRGYSTRAAVYLRYGAHFLELILWSAITHRAMEAAGPYAIDGGAVMFFLSALTVAVGAAATVAFSPYRNQILEQVRFYVFGMMVRPGAAVAVILWIVNGFVADQADPDAFTRTVDIGLLMVFGAILIMPPVIFVRLMAGIRSLHRSNRDDQEMMQTWSRQDGHQL